MDKSTGPLQMSQSLDCVGTANAQATSALNTPPSLGQESLLVGLGICDLVDQKSDTTLGDDVRCAIANLDGDDSVGRIFNSWVDAYEYTASKVVGGAMGDSAPTLTGVPFNDAYRYMDWLLTVPLLLIEILLVMNLPDAEYSSKAWSLGFGSALMIISGYYGELVVTGDLTPRWMCWFLSMVFFLYIVYELLVGLSAATNSESDAVVKGKIQTAQLMTVVSWCTYPVVYLFPMLGINAAHAVVSIQIGYCCSDHNESIKDLKIDNK